MNHQEPKTRNVYAAPPSGLRVGAIVNFTPTLRCRIESVGERAVTLRMVGNKRQRFTSKMVKLECTVAGLPFIVTKATKRQAVLTLDQEKAKELKAEGERQKAE